MAVHQSNRVFGYARVSTSDQTTAAQLAAFHRAGITNVVEEKASAVKDRPELERLLDMLQPGDVLAVYKLDRLARSVLHFSQVFDRLKAKGVGFRSLTEAIETDSPQGRMFIHMLSAFAEFERELIRERCLAGQRAARAAGRSWAKKRALSDDLVVEVVTAWRSGWYDQKTLADMVGCSVSALRDHIHRYEGRGRWSRSHALA
jgi:DNA invertase Pin-like site-specific DNA recombinase